jgi:alkylation response protein AidB-like acyl-CoA dehydrogenase
MDGAHVYNEVFFKDVRIPAKDLIGVEGEGWALTRQTMNFERSGSGSMADSKRKLERMIEYVKATKRDGKRLSEDPIVRQKLVKIFIDTQVGETLAYKIAWLQKKQDMMNVISTASESKLFSTELSQRIANFSTEIMGQYGQIEESEWAPLNGLMTTLYQFCMGQNIYAGSNEIQRNLIAWTGLGLPRWKMTQ